MYIELDKEKIEREGIYNYEKMQQHIDERIIRFGGYKDNDGWYTNGTWEAFMAIALSLAEADWFMDNVKQMLWNNKDYEEGPYDVCIEDMLEGLKNSKVWKRYVQNINRKWS